jgi:class 3 adenylate cyclase/tetratricopeptide (TPR) repeat protein
MTASLACSECGVLSTPAAVYCAQCGAQLISQTPLAPTHASRSKVERRQLTLMFCDLVGSTRLSLALDAEEFAEAINAYRDTCARVVKQWDGFVSRFVGDGVLVYFGYPRASEDDALRAITAAWELTKAVAALDLHAGHLDERRALRLHARIGLHTGLVVVGEIAGRDSHEMAGVLGAAPNIAARLQALCQPGEVVISDTTAELLPPTVGLRALELPEHSEIGAVRAFCVTEMPRETMSRRALSSSGLVGRQTTLDRLSRLLKAAAGARPLVLHVCGEPGVGKSRLLRETIAHAGLAQVRWIELSCSAYGQLSPLHPFRDLIDIGGLRELPLLDAPGTTPYDQRRQSFQRLRASLLADAVQVALLVEDMHWADSTTLEFLAELMALEPCSLVAILMTSREPPHTSIAAALTHPSETLARLAPGEAAALARGMETPRALNAFELAEVVRHADGVPLFIEEFVRAIAGKRAGEDGIPVTLRDALMSVLDTLGDARAVTLCASVFGQRFTYAQLRALLPLDDDGLTDTLRTLVQAKVLVQSGEMPAASFEFRHALLRDTAYHTLLRSERSRWHRRVAELAAAGALTGDNATPEVLATHHSLGGNHAGAIRYWLQAQAHAMGRSAHAEALAHLRSGLADCAQLAHHRPEEAQALELELLRRLATPLVAISGWSTPELETVYARAMQLCAAAESTQTRFELERGLYNMHLLRGDLRRASDIADRLLSSARAAPPGESEARLLVALRCEALPHFYRGEFTAARACLSAMLSLYDPAAHEGRAAVDGIEPLMLANAYLGWMDAAQGDADEARACSDRAIAHARREQHVFSLCYALCFAASTAQLCGDASRAEACAAEALALGNRHNFQYWIAWAQAVQGWIVGRRAPTEGISLIDDAVGRYLATGSTLVRPYFEALACQTARASGGADVEVREARLRALTQASGVQFWCPVLRPDISVDIVRLP